MKEPFRPIATNLTPVRVIGVPGLALVIIAIALAWQFPEVQWLIAATVIGGGAIAVLLIRRRGHASSHDDDRWSHGMLALEDRGSAADRGDATDRLHGRAPLWAPARATVS